MEVFHAPDSVVRPSATESLPDAVRGNELRARIDAAIRAAGSGSTVELTGDGRLALVAAWTSAHLAEEGSPPPHPVLEFLCQHAGLVEPAPHLVMLSQTNEDLLEAGINDAVSRLLARQEYNRYGAFVTTVGSLHSVVIALSSRWIELDAVPQQMAVGEELALNGRLTGLYRNPTLVVGTPDGEIQRVSLPEGSSINHRVRLSQPGAFGIEILATGPRGSAVVADFVVYAGQTPPNSVSVLVDPSGNRLDPEGVALELLRHLNETRQRAGVPPVNLSSRLSQVAEAHSRDMVDSRYVGHTSPSTGGPSDRTAAAGLRPGLVLENIGRGYGALQIHQGLLASPAHRANILNREVTDVGIGVVAEAEGERTAFVVTQVLTRQGVDIDVGSAPSELLAAINSGRSARRVAPLSTHEPLRVAAQAAADEYFSDPEITQQETVGDATDAVSGLSLVFRNVAGVMAVVTDLSGAERLEPLFDSEARSIGIGVAQGNRPDAPENAIAVVIVLGTPQ